MRFIANMIDHRKVRRALFDYPIYSPPFHDSEAVLSDAKIRANFDYFLAQKQSRLKALADYLRSFSIELTLSDRFLPTLDSWIFRYGGHLLPSDGEVISAIHDYEPAWTGPYHGINIVHDISIFAGDLVVSKNADIRWNVYHGDGTRRDHEEMGFGQPCLVGIPHFGYESHCPIFYEVFRWFAAARHRLAGRIGLKMDVDRRGSFAEHLNFLAAPEPPPVVPLSQRVIDD
ncbi:MULTISPECIES: hypothetical protein [unclassified Bradyrhizobium]|uniref:hypothetical protein n=1 Tax=unclassified Bradyrhizobium TaxID=2631580 RepID=UPI0028E44476|nr:MULTISPECIES: hypothetical protein [unclassified Bradyrhizobium]